jgi:hypothetical protein
MRADAETLIETGFGCMVKGRIAHRTDSDCLKETDWLIPLKDMEEADAHGYERCKKCGSTSAAEASETTAI